MIEVVLILGLILFIALYWNFSLLQLKWWQRKYLQQTLSSMDKQVLLKYMPIYRNMTDADRAQLEKHMVWFLGEKQILGRDGLRVTSKLGRSIPMLKRYCFTPAVIMLLKLLVMLPVWSAFTKLYGKVSHGLVVLWC